VPLAGGERSVTVPLKIVYSSYTGPEAFKVGAVFASLDADVAEAIRSFVDSP
jgi:hypothetical protein